MLPANADASIGTVTVGGDWVGGSIVAGAQNLGVDDVVGGMGASADNVDFGDGHDFIQTVDDTPLTARIKTINIKGNVIRTLVVGDHFGFVAQQIAKLKIDGIAVPLTNGPSNDSGIYLVIDAQVQEVA
jgi:hypothetical protein